jgi:chromosome segregation ATPase
MLVWWIVSLVILIICFVFAYRMIVSSYEFLPSDKRYLFRFNKNVISNERISVQSDSLKVLKKKVQSVEDNTTFYEIQFSKFQERLTALEELTKLKSSSEKIIIPQESKEDDEEDWKELYYEENTIKEKLENELDITKQLLEEAENKLKNSSEKNAGWVELQSNYETRLHDLHSLQNNIGLLERQLEASAEREKELEQLLLSEITMREKYSLLQKEFIELQSEADDLRRRIVELNKKDVDLQVRIVHLSELESRLALCEEEKIKLKSNLEELFQQNQALSRLRNT